MSLNEARTRLKEELEAYRDDTSSSKPGKRGRNKANYFIEKIDKGDYRETLDLVRAIYEDPRYKEGETMRARLRPVMLAVLGFEQNDYDQCAQHYTDISPRFLKASPGDFLEMAKKDLLKVAIEGAPSKKSLKKKERSDEMEMGEKPPPRP
ncbi:hypothetical protein ACQUW5_01380 [Legionella sp. CNM-1927-20]|uniref:hypothetical protein n=1 Tax=Legionella sp. CNM-1927-20 TaxID=3422221 RepID=UPI00403A893F